MTPLARCSASRFPRGIFTLSVDFELAWGTLDKPGWQRYDRLCRLERERVLGPLLDLLARYQIRACWCVVGHLFLDRCRAHSGVGHPEIARPPGNSLENLRFQRDPRGSVLTHPNYYAPDWIDAIRSCSTPQEIGCHSFSHAIFTRCSARTADSELSASRAVAARRSLELTSFVFPRNRVAHLDLLARHGFEVFRGPDLCWHERAPRRGWIHRLGHLADIAIMKTPPTVMPVRHPEGIWEIPGSMLYTPSHGPRVAVPVAMRVRRARKGLEAARRDGRIFHLWLHPTDLAIRSRAMLAGLQRILEMAAAMRARGEIEILSMSDIAGRLDASSSAVPAGFSSEGLS